MKNYQSFSLALNRGRCNSVTNAFGTRNFAAASSPVSDRFSNRGSLLFGVYQPTLGNWLHMSLFVRVNTGFYTHLKTFKLRAKLGNDAFWIPPRIWAITAEQRPDGNLEGISAEELAMLIGFLGDAPSMLQALLQAGFLDSDPLRVHNWSEYNGYHATFKQRATSAAKARWDKVKNAVSSGEESTGEEKRRDKHCLEQCSSIHPLNGKPEQGELPAIKSPAPKDEARPENVDACRGYAVELKMPAEQGNAFFDFFSSNGWKVGGKAPMKDWRCAMRNWKRNAANFGTNRNQQNAPYGKYI